MWGFLCVFRAFPVCVLCSCVFSFLQSLPPPPFFRSNSFRCSIAYSMLSLCVPLFLLYPSFLSRYLLLFYSLCPSLLSLLCVRLLTHALYFPCVPFVPVLSSSLSSFTALLISVLGLSVPFVLFLCFLCACFQPRCPHLPGAISPFFPSPFPPLPSSFRCYPSPFLRSFPLLRFPFRKKFPLKSRVISSVKYMFYSIFLVCLGKFS